jgi:hypothetical protein
MNVSLISYAVDTCCARAEGACAASSEQAASNEMA